MKVDIRDVSFSYGSNPVFENISLQVREGEVCCLMGINGCGKSTLIDCVLGVNECAEGEVLVEGGSVKKMKPYELAHRLAYIPQVHDRSFPYKVRDVVLMGRTVHKRGFGIPDAHDREISMQALERCRIIHLADRPYTQISGGEMQMVMLARALAQGSPVMVMDEPTAHLDFRNELAFQETVVELVTKKNIGVLIATHSPNQAYYFESCGVDTSVGLMSCGEMRALGSPSEVLTEGLLSEVYDIDIKIIKEDNFKQILPVRTGR